MTCSLCRKHPAVGTQYPRRDVPAVPVCELCAAPGQELGELPAKRPGREVLAELDAHLAPKMQGFDVAGFMRRWPQGSL